MLFLYFTHYCKLYENGNIVQVGLEFGWKIVFPFDWKRGPGAAVEPTVRNRKVAGSSPNLCTFVWVRLGTITILSGLCTMRKAYSTKYAPSPVLRWTRPIL